MKKTPSNLESKSNILSEENKSYIKKNGRKGCTFAETLEGKTVDSRVYISENKRLAI